MTVSEGIPLIIVHRYLYMSTFMNSKHFKYPVNYVLHVRHTRLSIEHGVIKFQQRPESRAEFPRKVEYFT